MRNMPETPSLTELKKAFQILFNTDGFSGTDPFSPINLPELQRAFRKKALETHPDRSKLLGKSETELIRRFNEVSSAYELLKPIVQNGVCISSTTADFFKNRRKSSPVKEKKPAPPKEHAPFTRFRKTKLKRDSYYEGSLPKFEMSVGQFLYYSGMISWATYIAALVWEHRQCPRFGQIARTWHMLSRTDVMEILKEKTYYEKFGEYALRAGYLTLFQQMAIIGRQRLMKPPPGKYFLENGLFSPAQIDQIVESILLHNRKYGPVSRQWK